MWCCIVNHLWSLKMKAVQKYFCFSMMTEAPINTMRLMFMIFFNDERSGVLLRLLAYKFFFFFCIVCSIIVIQGLASLVFMFYIYDEHLIWNHAAFAIIKFPLMLLNTTTYFCRAVTQLASLRATCSHSAISRGKPSMLSTRFTHPFTHPTSNIYRMESQEQQNYEIKVSL